MGQQRYTPEFKDEAVRQVADQLGHADPSLTIRTYAHAMPDEETDLSFADFSSEAVAGRRYTSLGENAGDAELAKSLCPSRERGDT